MYVLVSIALPAVVLDLVSRRSGGRNFSSRSRRIRSRISSRRSKS